MGSESDAKDFEVKKARTRARSKLKRHPEGDIKPSNHRTQNSEECSNGTESSAKKPRAKKSQRSVADTVEMRAENDKDAVTEKVKKSKHGKRLGEKKHAAREEITDDCAPKKSRKESSEAVDDEEKMEVDEGGTNDTKKPKKPSKRQLKREKAEQRMSLIREAGKLEATEKALNYVSKWKHAKSEWKFEKLRQIWLMDHLLDDELIPDEIFPTVLEYFEGCKGMAREQLLKKGMDVIKKREEIEEKATDEEEEVAESVEYKRARQLLQALPTET